MTIVNGLAIRALIRPHQPWTSVRPVYCRTIIPTCRRIVSRRAGALPHAWQVAISCSIRNPLCPQDSNAAEVYGRYAPGLAVDAALGLRRPLERLELVEAPAGAFGDARQ